MPGQSALDPLQATPYIAARFGHWIAVPLAAISLTWGDNAVTYADRFSLD